MIGRIINGYEIQEFKGSGTFGSVYVCVRNGEKYAMKIFHFNYIQEEYRRGTDNRIERELIALQTIYSPHVVRYIDHGEFLDKDVKYLYLVMDYVEGATLQEILDQSSLDQNQLKKVFGEIVQGVNTIHECNIVHRDLKPENIYVLPNLEIKILDFGLSKLIDYTSITSTGEIIGSPLYLSPEQIRDSKNIDYRSDYYALGVILYTALTKQSPYGNIQSREELFYKILNEPPIGIRQYLPLINNELENFVLGLLEKENFRRPNNIDTLLELLDLTEDAKEVFPAIQFEPKFFFRAYNEKQVLNEFYDDGHTVDAFIFPINHEVRQGGVLKRIQESKAPFIVDPATMRLAYDSYSDVKGLMALPYAPDGLNRLELNDLKEVSTKRSYVKSVVDEQLRLNASYIVAPFHVSNNSNLVRIKETNEENWFSLDIKLLYETREYLKAIGCRKKLIAGICVKSDILTSKSEREYFLNVISALPCDAYWVYVDCIDSNSNTSVTFQYVDTLLELQKSSSKPVIAGRIGAIGLILQSFGLYAFESGAARFESFYEDLYKETRESYNMYVSYYIPELMRNVSIERKKPTRILEIAKSVVADKLECQCPYCLGKRPDELVDDSLTKKHFLFRRQEEMELIRSMKSKTERISYIESRVDMAYKYHKEISPIYKDEDYRFLRVWKDTIENLKAKWA